MSMKEALRIIYAPKKALQNIIQNPRYIGPLFVLILFVIANTGFGYAVLSKNYVDQTVPSFSSKDVWTENATYWNSNGGVTLNSQDYISSQYFGNKSIEFDFNGSQLYSQLNLPTTVNCSSPDGYRKLSFATKLTSPQTNPSTLILYVNTTSEQNAFYQDITNQLNQTGIWNNLTIAIGQASAGWQSIGNPDWGNVTGLRMQFTWLTESNITLLVDGLFFHGLYKSALEVYGFSLVAVNSLLNGFMQFTIQWVILGVILYFVPKMFGVKTKWKPLLIVAGFIMIVYVIQMTVFALMLAASPPILDTSLFLESVYYQAWWYMDKVAWVWVTALCAIAFRIMFELPWTKSILTAVSSFALYFLLLLFLAFLGAAALPFVI